jgi:hypothetical protein
MAQSNLKTAFGVDLGMATLVLVRSCNPRARVVRRRLREIAAGGPSLSAIGKAWAADRHADLACPPWALAA